MFTLHYTRELTCKLIRLHSRQSQQVSNYSGFMKQHKNWLVQPKSCNEALYSTMIVAVGLLGPLPRSNNPLQATYTLGRCQASMICCEKCSPIFIFRIWNSCPDKSECQCSILQWGTVFTNDCCSRLVGSISKVWQPFTSYIHTGKMPDINDVWSKM